MCSARIKSSCARFASKTHSSAPPCVHFQLYVASWRFARNSLYAASGWVGVSVCWVGADNIAWALRKFVPGLFVYIYTYKCFAYNLFRAHWENILKINTYAETASSVKGVVGGGCFKNKIHTLTLTYILYMGSIYLLNRQIYYRIYSARNPRQINQPPAAAAPLHTREHISIVCGGAMHMYLCRYMLF